MNTEQERAAFEAWFAGYRHAWKTERDVALDAWQARAALAAAPAPAPGWQPIETAPKDGSAILVNAGGFSYVVEWGSPDVAWWCVDDNKHGPFPLRGAAPTHWMPLPAAPEAGQGKEASDAT